MIIATSAAGSATHTESIEVKDILVVALGDSYSSGEGNREVMAGANDDDVGGWATIGTSEVTTDDMLRNRQHALSHRSSAAHTARLALELEQSDPHTSVTFVFLAASGGTIREGGIGPYNGREDVMQAGGQPLPPQVDQLNEIVGNQQVDVMTLSFGGNDVGFSRVVTALLSFDNADASELNLIQQAMATGTQPRWEELNSELHPLIDIDTSEIAGFDDLADDYARLNREINGLAHRPANIFITQYPDPMSDGPNPDDVCDMAMDDILPNASSGVLSGEIDEAELRWVRENFLNRVNEFVEQAARDNGWIFVDGLDEAFRGNGICQPDGIRYIRTATGSQDLQGPRGDWADTVGTLHPSDAAHAATANILREFVEPALQDRSPLIILPDLLGSIPKDAAAHETWLTHLGHRPGFGVAPDQLELFEPIYGSLVKTLEPAGYKEGVDLFVVPYDWRLPIAEPDVDESDDAAERAALLGGKLTEVTKGELITDDFLEYGIDYLGQVLRQVAIRKSLTSRDDAGARSVPALVDVIGHGAGGLISRLFVE